VQAITEYAESLGMDVHEIDLDDQFRCGGSALYVEWVERLLGLTPAFKVGVVDSPAELQTSWRCGRRTATRRAWRPVTAGRRQTPSRTRRWCRTCGSATGQSAEPHG